MRVFIYTNYFKVMHGVGVYGWYWSVALLWCNSEFLQLQADS
jgi:hypothetical protein